MSVNVSNCLLICSKTRAIFQMQHPSLNRKTETEFKKCQQWTRFIDLKQLLFLPFLKWHVRLWFSTNFQNSSITLIWRGRERERERKRQSFSLHIWSSESQPGFKFKTSFNFFHIKSTYLCIPYNVCYGVDLSLNGGCLTQREGG